MKCIDPIKFNVCSLHDRGVDRVDTRSRAGRPGFDSR